MYVSCTPRAIAWLGARSFWGHLWHLAASAIATEDIDSRDWMVADEPDELTDVRAHSADGVLRGLALAELASAEGDRVLPALRSAKARFPADAYIGFSVDLAIERIEAA